MPKGPKGQKRPADVIGNAVHVLRLATGGVLLDLVTLLEASESKKAG